MFRKPVEECDMLQGIKMDEKLHHGTKHLTKWTSTVRIIICSTSLKFNTLAADETLAMENHYHLIWFSYQLFFFFLSLLIYNLLLKQCWSSFPTWNPFLYKVTFTTNLSVIWKRVTFKSKKTKLSILNNPLKVSTTPHLKN